MWGEHTQHRTDRVWGRLERNKREKGSLEGQKKTYRGWGRWEMQKCPAVLLVRNWSHVSQTKACCSCSTAVCLFVFFFLHHQKYILFMTWNPHKTLFLVFFPLSDYWQPHETYFWVRSKALVSSLRDDRNHFWNKSTYSVVSVCGKFSLRRLRREQLQCRCWCLTSDTEVLQLPEVGAKRTFTAVCAQSQQLCFDFCHSSSCNRVHWLFSCIVHTKTSFLIHCDIDMSTQWAFLKIDKPHINFLFFFFNVFKSVYTGSISPQWRFASK